MNQTPDEDLRRGIVNDAKTSHAVATHSLTWGGRILKWGLLVCIVVVSLGYISGELPIKDRYIKEVDGVRLGYGDAAYEMAFISTKPWIFKDCPVDGPAKDAEDQPACDLLWSDALRAEVASVEAQTCRVKGYLHPAVLGNIAAIEPDLQCTPTRIATEFTLYEETQREEWKGPFFKEYISSYSARDGLELWIIKDEKYGAAFFIANAADGEVEQKSHSTINWGLDHNRRKKFGNDAVRSSSGGYELCPSEEKQIRDAAAFTTNEGRRAYLRMLSDKGC